MSRKNTKGTILAIDMGNTNIVIGCVDDDKVIFEERLSTDLSKTELEYAISFKNVLEIYNNQRILMVQLYRQLFHSLLM